jgi:hypothetical protein
MENMVSDDPIVEIVRRAIVVLNNDYRWDEMDSSPHLAKAIEADKTLDKVLALPGITPIEATLAIYKWQSAWAKVGKDNKC